MAGKQAARLARTLRNPIDMLEVAGIIRDAADAMEKQAAEAGRSARERPRVLRALSFASELEEAANVKIGDHEARLKRG
jgi:hypothetical protein